MPRLLCQTLGRIVGEEPDLQIVSEFMEARPDLADLMAADPDFVILGLGGGGEPADPDLIPALLSWRRRLRVLGVTADGRDGFVYEMWPHRVPVGELSARRIVDLIRAGSTDTAQPDE
jgi:hypothetical protein